MSVYLPPIAKKKKVDRFYNDNMSCVFGRESREKNVKSFVQSIYQQDFLHVNAPPARLQITSPGRRNKPQPTSVNFNWKNSRSLCKPFCCVETRSVKNAQANWWPEGIPKDERPQPKYSLDSTSRTDYTPIDIAAFKKISREETQLFLKSKQRQATSQERISFNHMYNCRLPNNQPERGKLHGSFIK